MQRSIFTAQHRQPPASGIQNIAHRRGFSRSLAPPLEPASYRALAAHGALLIDLKGYHLFSRQIEPNQKPMTSPHFTERVAKKMPTNLTERCGIDTNQRRVHRKNKA